jgi:hypothetical protein
MAMMGRGFAPFERLPPVHTRTRWHRFTLCIAEPTYADAPAPHGEYRRCQEFRGASDSGHSEGAAAEETNRLGWDAHQYRR